MTAKPLLLVEDNADDELLTIEALQSNNISNEVIVARNGVEALEYLFARGVHRGRNVADLPALVLLDLKLPMVDGLEVLEQIRSDDRTRLLPVVILTSSVEDEDRVRGYSLGANSYVRKPVDFEEFIRTAGQLGLYWLLLNEQPPGRQFTNGI